MGQNWKETTIGDAPIHIGDGNYSSMYPKSSEFVSTGVPFITASDFKNGRIFPDKFRFISPEQHATLKKGHLKNGDVLVVTRGAGVGTTAWVDPQYEESNINAQLVLLRADNQELHNKFLYYLLSSEEYKALLISFSSGSAQPQLPIKSLVRVPITYPSFPEQCAIAETLAVLDDKIENNRLMNQTIETMVRAMFRHWFVESGEVGNWEIGKFSEISDITRDSVNPGQFPDEVFNHYSIPAHDEKHFPVSELGDQIKSNKFVVPNHCVLISKLNPETPRIWLPFKLENRSICSTEFLVNIPKGYFSPEYLFGLFYSQSFQDRFISMVTGTSGSHQRVKAEYVHDMDIEIPPENLVAKYTETVRPLLQKIQQNILESRTLASLRDTLLPKLMRGEARVSAL